MDKNGDGLVTKQVWAKIEYLHWIHFWHQCVSLGNSIMINCHDKCFRRNLWQFAKTSPMTRWRPRLSSSTPAGTTSWTTGSSVRWSSKRFGYRDASFVITWSVDLSLTLLANSIIRVGYLSALSDYLHVLPINTPWCNISLEERNTKNLTIFRKRRGLDN